MTLQKHVSATDLQRNAYNAAFYELGLGWHWDSDTFDGLLPVVCKTERIHRYMMSHQSHLLHAYAADFLANAIEATKSHCLDRMLDCRARGAIGAPGATGTPGADDSHIDWAALHSPQIGA